MAAGYQSRFTGKQIDNAIGKIPSENPTVDSVIIVNTSGTSIYKPITSLGSQNIQDGTGQGSLIQTNVKSSSDEPYTNVASGPASIALGKNTKALGNTDFVIGQNNEANASGSFVGGINCKNTDNSAYSIVFGDSVNNQNATKSIAMGSDIQNSAGNSVVFGSDITNPLKNSVLMGRGLRSQDYLPNSSEDGVTILGRYNKRATQGEDADGTCFIIGNGTSDTNRSNAVKLSAAKGLESFIEPKTDYGVVRKKELDTKQATLVSGTNIKTINNQSILGSGNISISGGPSVVQSTGTSTTSVMSQNAVTTELNKKITAPNNWTGSGYGADSVLTRFDADGHTGMWFIRTKLNSDGAGDGIIGYDGTGHCEVSTPVKELQAANKKYVDNAIAAIPGGTTVTANASGTAAAVLTSLQVGSSIYSIPQTPTDYVKTWGAQTVGGNKTFTGVITCTNTTASVFKNLRVRYNTNSPGGRIFFGKSDANVYVGEGDTSASEEILTLYGAKGIILATANNKDVKLNGVALNGVVANPTGTGTTALTKLQVGSTIYSISAGSSYTLPVATSSMLGGIKTGFTNIMNSFAVETQTDGKAYVTVPLQSTTGTSEYAIMSQKATTTAIQNAITDAITSVLSTAV